MKRKIKLEETFKSIRALPLVVSLEQIKKWIKAHQA